MPEHPKPQGLQENLLIYKVTKKESDPLPRRGPATIIIPLRWGICYGDREQVWGIDKIGKWGGNEKFVDG